MISIGAMLAACVLAAAAPRAKETLDATYFERCLFVRAAIGDTRDLVFLVDTGASCSAIDAKVARRLALEPLGTTKVEGTAGTIAADRVRVPRLALGALASEPLVATCQDLGGSLHPPGTELAGILGYDVLGRLAITIDYRGARITLAREPDDEEPEPDEHSVAVPFVLDQGVPRIDVVLDATVRTQLRIDTGASLFETSDVYLNVTQRDWRALTAQRPALVPVRHLTGTGIGGKLDLPVARLTSAGIGTLVIDQPFAIVQPSQGYFAREDAVGFVGNNLLEKHGPVTIDYPARRLVLTR